MVIELLFSKRFYLFFGLSEFFGFPAMLPALYWERDAESTCHLSETIRNIGGDFPIKLQRVLLQNSVARWGLLNRSKMDDSALMG
jgi:hypothetical protein